MNTKSVLKYVEYFVVTHKFVNSEYMFMEMNMEFTTIISDKIMTGKETITTPEGTFDCMTLHDAYRVFTAL